MILLALLALLVAVPVGAHAEPAFTRTDAFATMSDGVRLEVSVYLPAGIAADAQLPLVVRQHGGGSNKDNGYDVGYGLKLVETQNFALLMYSHRGHGNSEGAFDFFGARTTKDFSEILDWAEETFGTRIDTENVGTNGYSQGGGESLLPAEHDARVKAVAVGQTFSDLNEALNPGDCVKLSFSLGIFALAYKTALAETDDVTAVRWGTHMYTDTEDVVGPPNGMSATQEMRAHSPIAYLDATATRPGLNVPTFWAQAWEDQLFPGNHPEMILEPLRAKGVPVHYYFSSGGHAANGDDPSDLAAREQGMRDWFDEFLRGVDHGFASGQRPLVDVWRRAAAGRPGSWAHETHADWPIEPNVHFVALGNGALARPTGPTTPPGPNVTIVNTAATANLAYDPMMSEVDNQSRGRGGPATFGMTGSAPESQNPADTVTFTSAPMDSPLKMTGAPEAIVHYDTTAQRVAQFATKVFDVAPDGSRRLISRGCSSIAQPADPVATLRLWPHAHTFEPGHRIQLTISTVDEPTFKADTEPQATTITGVGLDLPTVD